MCNARPPKAEPNRTRLAVGGDRINYPEDCGTSTADMFLVKLLLNSVISTKGARFMTGDINNFYLNELQLCLCASNLVFHLNTEGVISGQLLLVSKHFQLY